MSDAGYRKRQRTRKITEAVRRSIIDDMEPPKGRLINLKLTQPNLLTNKNISVDDSGGAETETEFSSDSLREFVSG